MVTRAAPSTIPSGLGVSCWRSLRRKARDTGLHPKRLAFFALLFGTLLDPFAAAAAASCQPGSEATLPLRFAENLPIIDVTIDNGAARLILDTGSEETVLSAAAAARLGLVAHYEYPKQLRGFGGGISSGVAVTKRFAAGALAAPGFIVMIESVVMPNLDGTQPDGLLGADFLANFDADFDLAHGRLTLYRQPCVADPPVWKPPFTTIAANRSLHGRLFFPVSLGGHQLYAFIDTGAQRSAIDQDAVRRLGVVNADLDRDPATKLRAIAPGTSEAHLHHFSQMAIGNTRVGDPTLAVTPLGLQDADVILGVDLIKNWRVWFSYSARRIFIKTAGKT